MTIAVVDWTDWMYEVDGWDGLNRRDRWDRLDASIVSMGLRVKRIAVLAQHSPIGTCGSASIKTTEKKICKVSNTNQGNLDKCKKKYHRCAKI